MLVVVAIRELAREFTRIARIATERWSSTTCRAPLVVQADGAHGRRDAHGDGMSKDQGIESLRGLAIVLLVGLHASPPPLENIGVMEGEGFWAYVSYCVMLLRMPLFTVISGYVYALRPLRAGASRSFLKGKARRLLLPFATISTLTFALMKAAGSETLPWGEIWKIYVFPYQHFWFLQALVLVFLAITLLEHHQALQTPRRWALALLGALLLQQAVDLAVSSSPLWEVLCFARAAYLLPFFVLGLGLCRFGGTSSTSVRLVASGLVVVTVVVQQLTWFGYTDLIVTKSSLLGMLTGMAATFLLLQHRHRFTFAPLARLGVHAYTIYLLHGLGLAVATRMYGDLGLTHPHVMFAAKMLVALALPIVAEHALRRIPPIRLVVLGVRRGG